jgi:hypothetical protein
MSFDAEAAGDRLGKATKLLYDMVDALYQLKSLAEQSVSTTEPAAQRAALDRLNACKPQVESLLEEFPRMFEVTDVSTTPFGVYLCVSEPPSFPIIGPSGKPVHNEFVGLAILLDHCSKIAWPKGNRFKHPDDPHAGFRLLHCSETRLLETDIYEIQKAIVRSHKAGIRRFEYLCNYWLQAKERPAEKTNPTATRQAAIAGAAASGQAETVDEMREHTVVVAGHKSAYVDVEAAKTIGLMDEPVEGESIEGNRTLPIWDAKSRTLSVGSWSKTYPANAHLAMRVMEAFQQCGWAKMITIPDLTSRTVDRDVNQSFGKDAPISLSLCQKTITWAYC